MMMEALPSLSNTQAVLSFPGSLCAPLNKHTHTHILSPRSAAHLSLLFFLFSEMDGKLGDEEGSSD